MDRNKIVAYGFFANRSKVGFGNFPQWVHFWRALGRPIKGHEGARWSNPTQTAADPK